jgi:hypothetical protein
VDLFTCSVAQINKTANPKRLYPALHPQKAAVMASPSKWNTPEIFRQTAAIVFNKRATQTPPLEDSAPEHQGFVELYDRCVFNPGATNDDCLNTDSKNI